MMKESLCLVIFWSTLSQGIGKFSQENIGNILEFHLRQKRVINNNLFENRPLRLPQIPFIVNILKNGRNECVGTILTCEIILTAAQCLREANSVFSVLTSLFRIGGGIRHNITKILIFPHFNQNELKDNLALLFIHPPINLVNNLNRRIEFFNGTLVPNTPATLSAWGYSHQRGNRLRVPSGVKSITLPIINLEECQRYYHNVRKITSINICTLDKMGKKYATVEDSGGPLVIFGELAGIYSWSGNNPHRENPNVFINLLHPLFRNWIFANIKLNHAWF